MLSKVAQEESRNTSSRIKFSKRLNAEKGKVQKCNIPEKWTVKSVKNEINLRIFYDSSRIYSTIHLWESLCRYDDTAKGRTSPKGDSSFHSCFVMVIMYKPTSIHLKKLFVTALSYGAHILLTQHFASFMIQKSIQTKQIGSCEKVFISKIIQ